MPASTSIFAERLSRSRVSLLALLAIFLTGSAGSAGAADRRVEKDPYFASFYEKARLIMTNEEIQIYKHLADAGAREEFIEEFWQKRDPLPDTAENEARAEFERRIAYANRWFRENRAAGRGWDTPRGRILMQLGEPDNRSLNDMISDPNVKGYERWIYYDYQLELVFVDSTGFGEYKLRNWPAELLTAIAHARFAINPAAAKSAAIPLQFQARYRDEQILISLPLKKVRFSESGETVHADFRITVYVYRDYAKIAAQVFAKRLQYARQSIPTEKTVGFSLTYPLAARGKYFLDIVLQDLLTGSRARNFIAFKL
jgi:GWxTD domain-containing protein